MNCTVLQQKMKNCLNLNDTIKNSSLLGKEKNEHFLIDARGENQSVSESDRDKSSLFNLVQFVCGTRYGF